MPGDPLRPAAFLAAGHGWGLAIFPLLAMVVAAVFGVDLFRRYLRSRRPHEGVWAVALLMYSVASGAVWWGVVSGWDPATFRTYYLLGAVLNVAYLFVGEVYLLSAQRSLPHVLLAVLVAGTAFAAWKISSAPIRAAFLDDALPLGREVFGSGSLPHRLAQYYSFPAYFLLLGGLVWSAWQMRDRADLRPRVGGILLIALGASAVAVGSGIGAAFHLVALFSVSLAAGVVVMYWGFLQASRRPGRAAAPTTAAAP
jgi:hypothetical protein